MSFTKNTGLRDTRITSTIKETQDNKLTVEASDNLDRCALTDFQKMQILQATKYELIIDKATMLQIEQPANFSTSADSLALQEMMEKTSTKALNAALSATRTVIPNYILKSLAGRHSAAPFLYKNNSQHSKRLTVPLYLDT